MGDIQTRPFSRNYSGLINQSVIAISITLICVTGQELMKRKRRGNRHAKGLGSRESWEFGYLYQGRSWARIPSPPSPAGWPLSWVSEVTSLPEAKMLELRGVDATLYIRFLRGCFCFTLLQTVTTFLILFPIHIEFSESTVSPKSMTRGSISSLVTTSKGLSFLWIHTCLLFWLTLSWIATLLWVCHGAFELRAAGLELKRVTSSANANSKYYPHPHPPYAFTDVPGLADKHPNNGLRLRTIMVSNIPPALRSEKNLKEYFEYYMSRKLDKPTMGLTSSTQPGFLNKSLAFLFNRVKRITVRLPPVPLPSSADKELHSPNQRRESPNAIALQNINNIPVIERVVVARNMTEIASLLERREDILGLLETAHIQLANNALMAVKVAMDRREANIPLTSRAAEVVHRRPSPALDLENRLSPEVPLDEEARMNQLIEVLGPFIGEFGLQTPFTLPSWELFLAPYKYICRQLRTHDSEGPSDTRTRTKPRPYCQPVVPPQTKYKTVWDALHALPRSSLDTYQPLINLNHLFRGKTVPSIDYYTAKLNMLSSLVTESRSKSTSDYEPVSTAFVTFSDPTDARQACDYLAVHPENPLACAVTMAPMYQDLDWIRVMKSSFNTEFVKDWVVNLGVWGFTLFWIFPVSLLVGLVSIQNISYFWPSLKAYLDRHRWQEEVIQSFLPTLLVALLALLIPLILLLIAKKAHTITTLSALHDRIMTRYYKFLVVNVLVFFCVGTAALQSFLESFKSTTSTHLLQVIADSFPTAGPFYVGWLILTTALHGGFEIALIGLPLIMYPSTSRQVAPRKRAVGIRPRTFNFYYWLPNHMLVVHVLLLFSVLNPFVLPFGVLYFFVEVGIVKNQLIYVYAKLYEGNGQLILIRIVRYSLDGLILTQAVFLAYMVVLKKTTSVGLAAFLIIFTVIAKILITRMCRTRFEQDDIAESNVMCGLRPDSEPEVDLNSGISERGVNGQGELNLNKGTRPHTPSLFRTWRLPAWVTFSYSNAHHRPHSRQSRHPNPFRPQGQEFARLKPMSQGDPQVVHSTPEQPRRFSSELPWGGASITSFDNNQSIPIYRNVEPSGPVVVHSPSLPWDDQITVDLPYDNPFYTRTIDNVLWLPRDPWGTLDLDDTIDLKVALTVEVTAGKLGTWLEVEETNPTKGTSQRGSYRLERQSTTANVPVDGTEDIDLPASIMKRIQSKEDGVKRTSPPRRLSGNRFGIIRMDNLNISEQGRGSRRPTISGPHFPSTLRSSSDDIQRADRGRLYSTMPSSQISPPIRRFAELDFLIQPDFHVHAEDAAPTNASAFQSVSRSNRVSARQAIFHEVLAEERAALIYRIEDEHAEIQKIVTNKSWLTSWMFKKRK